MVFLDDDGITYCTAQQDVSQVKKSNCTFEEMHQSRLHYIQTIWKPYLDMTHHSIFSLFLF